MNWKWTVDRRSGRVQIDKRALSIAIAGGIGLYWIVRAVVPGDGHYAVAALLAVVGIAFDIWLHRRDPDQPSHQSSDPAGR